MINGNENKPVQDVATLDADYVAKKVYQQLRDRYENDPLSMDLTDKILLLTTASISYLSDWRHYKGMAEDFRKMVETRLNMAAALSELYRHGKYQGQNVMEDMHALIPEDTEAALIRVGMIDLAQRVRQLFGGLSLFMRDEVNSLPDRWPFSEEKLEAERRLMAQEGHDPTGHGFEREAQRRAALKILMGPGRFAHMEGGNE